MNAATLRACALGVAVFLSGGAFAATNKQPLTIAQISARSVQAKYGNADEGWRSLNRIYGSTAAVGAVEAAALWESVIKGPGPLGDIDVKQSRSIPYSKIAKGAARGLPLLGTALLLSELMTAIRCREAPGGGGECDAGVPEALTAAYKCDLGALTNTGSSPSAACTAVMQAFHTANYTHPAGPSSLGTVNCPGFPAQPNYGSCNASGYWPFGSTYLTASWTKVEALACPTVTLGGITSQGTKGPDGKCNSFVYAPQTFESITAKAVEYGDKSKAGALATELEQGGVELEHSDVPSVDPVADAVNAPRVTTTHPDGSVTIKDVRFGLTPLPGGGYEWIPTTTEKTYPPGATLPAENEPVEGGTTTTGGGAPAEDSITCGLPNTPPCKIDESGTPPPDDPFEQNPDSWFDPIRLWFTDPEVTDTAWTFSFELPTGCTVLSIGPFFTKTVVVDLCAYQPMIHEFMSIIWYMTGVWVCIGMVGRTLGA